MKKVKRTIPVGKRGWSLPTHFINTAVAAFSMSCLILTGVMWLTAPDPHAMAMIIASLFDSK